MATMTIQSAEVMHDGRTIRLVFSGTLPATRGAVDWYPGWLSGVQRSLSTGAAFYFSGGSPVVNGGNLEWHVRLVIRTPGDRIIFGQSGVTISAGEGFLQDDQGNTSAEFSAFAVTNYSYVNSSGFLATITPSGGAITRYVSFTNGNDANPGTELSPWKTLSYAQTRLYDTGHGSDGSQLLLLEGDRWPVGADFSWNQGASFSRPFVMSHYWHDYGTGGVGTGQQGVRPSIRPSNGTLGMLRTGGAGRPASLSYVIVDGLECSFPSSNGNGSSGGLICQMPDAHWMFIDCRTLGGVTGIEIAASGAGADYMSVVRCTILDTFESVAPGGSSTGSGLHLAQVRKMTVSEVTIDRCGMQENTLTYGGSRSRNFYPDVSVPHLAYWGGFNCRSSSEAVQVRGDGDVFGVIIDDCSQAGFIQHGGGRIAMCITLRTRDANYWNTTTLVGYSVPLGWNWYVGYDSGSHSVEQDDVPGAMEGCIIECCAAGPSLSTASGRCFALNWNNTPGSESRHIYRNNTAIDTMMIYYSGDGASYLPESFKTRRNLCSNTASPFNVLNHVAASYASYAWMDNDQNCYHSSNAAKTVVMNSDGTDYTLAAYTALTGQETGSVETAPAFVDSAADLGDWYASSGGSNSISAFYTAIRDRAMGTWPAWMDSLAASRFFLAQFQHTTPAVNSSDVLGKYGVPTDDQSYINPDPQSSSAYPPSFNLAASGVAAAFAPFGRCTNILVIGDQNMHLANGMMRAIYTLTPDLCGWFFQGITGSGVDQPVTGATDVTTNLTIGAALWPFRGDGQPNAPGIYRAGIYDTASTAGDGTVITATDSGGIPAAFQEFIWPQSASAPGAAQRFVTYTLNTYTGRDAWALRALTITPFAHFPAADATGVNPILGGPALSVGVWRGNNSPTVTTAFAAGSQGAIVAGTPASLAAAAGLPRVGLYWPTSAANSKRRCILPGFMAVNDEGQGVRLVCAANPYATIGGYDHAADAKFSFSAFTVIGQTIGGFNAIVLMLGSELDAGFLNRSDYGDMISELKDPDYNENQGGGSVGSWNEVLVDLVNGARQGLGDFTESRIPVLCVLPVFAGQGDSLAEWDAIHENILQETWFMCTNAVTAIDGPWPPPIGLHKWTKARCAYIDLNGVATPTQVMTGGKILKGGTTVRGTWSSVISYVAGDITAAPNAAFAGLSGAHNWFVSKTSHSNKEPGVAADWADHWDKLDFRPTQAFAAEQWAFVLAALAAAGSDSSMNRASSRNLRRVMRGQRSQR